MKYPHRCGSCKARTTLRRKVQNYIRTPKCPSCRGLALRFDASEYKRRLAMKPCRCDGYHFPHREGGGVWCIHSMREPTNYDYLDRYSYTPTEMG